MITHCIKKVFVGGFFYTDWSHITIVPYSHSSKTDTLKNSVPVIAFLYQEIWAAIKTVIIFDAVLIFNV